MAVKKDKAGSAKKAPAAKKAAPKAKAAPKVAAKAPRAAKAASGKPSRIGTKHLAERMVEQFEISKKDAVAYVTHFFDELGHRLSRGEIIAVPAFGRFAVRERAAKIGRNPQTGEEVQIPAKRVARFTPSKALKEAVGTTKRAR